MSEVYQDCVYNCKQDEKLYFVIRGKETQTDLLVGDIEEIRLKVPVEQKYPRTNRGKLGRFIDMYTYAVSVEIVPENHARAGQLLRESK